jgi:hypothetical protein
VDAPLRAPIREYKWQSSQYTIHTLPKKDEIIRIMSRRVNPMSNFTVATSYFHYADIQGNIIISLRILYLFEII